MARGRLRKGGGGPPAAGVEPIAEPEREAKALPAMGPECGRSGGSPVLLLLQLLLSACPLRSALMFPGEGASRERL